jgi:hypothetical protein
MELGFLHTKVRSFNTLSRSFSVNSSLYGIFSRISIGDKRHCPFLLTAVLYTTLSNAFSFLLSTIFYENLATIKAMAAANNPPRNAQNPATKDILL